MIRAIFTGFLLIWISGCIPRFDNPLDPLTGPGFLISSMAATQTQGSSSSGGPGAASSFSKIALIVKDSGFPDLHELRIMNPDGTQMQTVFSTNTAGVRIDHVRWAPDRSKFLLSYITGGSNPNVAVIGADGTGFQLLRSLSGACCYGTWVNWWDNSSYIYTDGTPTVSVSIRKSNLDGSGDALFTNESIVSAPADTWGIGSVERSPDGSKVIFMNTGAGNTYHYLYTINADGASGFTNLNVLTYNNDPRYSPDGTRIAYGFYTGVWKLGYANADGTGQVDLSAFIPGNVLIGWHDATSLIYWNNGAKEIQRRNLDGSAHVTLAMLGPTQTVSNGHK